MQKTPKTISQFISSYFDALENSHNNINIEITTKVFVLLKTKPKLQHDSMFC
jgi:hypothetical protein